ncbi:MAG: crAss001_48 related protein [Lepagella sp.]
MKPFELRLAHEHLKVSRHCKNLQSYIDDEVRFSRLPREQRSLMLEQAEILEEYKEVLEKRLKLLNIPV